MCAACGPGEWEEVEEAEGLDSTASHEQDFVRALEGDLVEEDLLDDDDLDDRRTVREEEEEEDEE